MNSFGSRSSLRVGNRDYTIFRLDALDKQGISTLYTERTVSAQTRW